MIELILTKWVVTFKNFFEWLKVVYLYYPAFGKIDMVLLAKYLFQNPYSICKQFLVERGADDPYAYGETPLTTLALISVNCEIKASDKVVELGCGRGRTCFWLNHFIHCRVRGIDFVPIFIKKANEVKEYFRLSGVEFECRDFFEVDFEGATLIYLYGTCLDDSAIERLIDKFLLLPSGTRIVTVSYPLNHPRFELIRAFPAIYTWGEAEVYYQMIC